MNLTFEITPTRDTGVLLYHNPDHRQRHLLVQLNSGAVRVSYYLGTTHGVSVETMPLLVKANQLSIVEIRVDKLNVEILIDEKQQIFGNISTGSDLEFLVDEQPSVYIGGLPQNLRDSAAKMYHIVPDSANSFSGCIHSIEANRRQLNFAADVVNKVNAAPGCEGVMDEDDWSEVMQADEGGAEGGLGGGRKQGGNEKRSQQMERGAASGAAKRGREKPCDYHMCRNGSTCENRGPVKYRCNCPLNSGGPMCSEKVECNVEKEKHFVVDGGCRSTKSIRYTECPKYCGGGTCCSVVKEKKISSRFTCSQNKTKTDQIQIPVVRKCECGPCEN